MGFFSRLKRTFSRKYTPIEALTYLRLKSSWFAGQGHLLKEKGKRTAFKNTFLKLIPYPNDKKALTVSDIEDYAKKALVRITVNRTYQIAKSRKDAEEFAKVKRKALDKERDRLKNDLDKVFRKQDKIVQREINDYIKLLGSTNLAVEKKVPKHINKIKMEIRVLEHEIVKVIRRNKGLSHEQTALLMDQLRKEILTWENLLKRLDLFTSQLLVDPMNNKMRSRSSNLVQTINMQIGHSISHFMGIEREIEARSAVAAK